MKYKCFISVCMTLLAMSVGNVFAADKAVSISAFDTMKYSTTKIEVHAGDKVTVTLTNEGNIPKAAMGHNWILLQAGTDPNAYARLAANAKDQDYEPKALSGKVIAAVPVLGPKEHASVTFKAPAAGTYHYLCSFPGHCAAGMTGEFVVQ